MDFLDSKESKFKFNIHCVSHAQRGPNSKGNIPGSLVFKSTHQLIVSLSCCVILCHYILELQLHEALSNLME